VEGTPRDSTPDHPQPLQGYLRPFQPVLDEPLVLEERGDPVTRLLGVEDGLGLLDQLALDVFEGKGNGYDDRQLTVEFQGQDYSCFTYVAQPSHIENGLKPYHWYKELVVLGARHLQFPNAYVRAIESIESVEDTDETRREHHNLLIEKIVNFR